MRFGVPLPTFRQAASREAIVRVAQLAEQLGYDGVWVSDHIVIPRTELDTFAHGFGDPTHIGSLIHEPLTVLAFVAACTNRIRLGTTVIILPYRNPLVTAKVLSTIDVLSGGRVTAGVGVGWMEAEFSALGVPYQGRGALSDEYIKAMNVLWSEDRPAFHGQHVQFENIGFDPKPVQKPHIPVWIGGNSRSAIRRAARLGDAWHPTRPQVQDIKAGAELLREFCDQHGRDPRSVTIAARLPLKFLDDSSGGATKRRPLLGSPQKIIDEIGQYRDAGVQYIVLDTFYSAPELEGETIDSILGTMERFAADVMPK
ncbi:MAG TPA: LLM class F420-dependent oxidoreductase [Blastocatellia bacterium]|nr:LLM class F420-dependent oxidoreductase [Blastocatellia bacterium]